jgi:hypothetical protein
VEESGKAVDFGPVSTELAGGFAGCSGSPLFRDAVVWGESEIF